MSRKELEFRTTDRYVRELQSQWPLSVSTNYIAHLAFRCAELLTELTELAGPIDRTGAGLTVEVYPAGALRQWGVVSRGYKPRSGQSEDRRRRQRETLWDLCNQIRAACAGWLDVSDSDVARMKENDHLLDSLVAALVARAEQIGLCLPIPPEHLAAAEVEGWIRLPRAQPLGSFRPA